MTPAPEAGFTLQHDETVRGRASVIGTIVLVLVFGGLMGTAVASIARLASGTQVVKSEVQASSAYQGVQRAMTTADLAQAAYLRDPSEQARAQFASAIAELNESVTRALRLGTVRDDELAGYLRDLNGGYDLILDAPLARGTSAATPAGFEMSRALDDMQRLVSDAVAHRHALAGRAVAAQESRYRILSLLAPAAVVVAMVAVGLCWSLILRQYRQLRGRAAVSEDRALHDVLTGTGNRALLSRGLAADLRRAEYDTALLMIDLDHFKEVNDLHGHAAGDEVLREVARRLHQITCTSGVVCRMGGDEFAVLVSPASAAQTVADEIRHALERPIAFDDLELRTHASIGHAILRPGMDERALLTEADESLYCTKRSARS